jgi:hypothetical protein
VEFEVRKDEGGIERSCMGDRGGTLVVLDCEGGIKLKIQKFIIAPVLQSAKGNLRAKVGLD